MPILVHGAVDLGHQRMGELAERLSLPQRRHVSLPLKRVVRRLNASCDQRSPIALNAAE